MPISEQDLEEFHEFAVGRSNNGGAELCLEQLAMEWQSLHQRDEVNEAIRQGLADVDAGRFRPVDEFNDELREKYNFGKQ